MMKAHKAYSALLLLPLAGCISFGAKPPKSLLTLNSTAAISVGSVRTAGPGETITIMTPSASTAVAAPRIPVYQGGVAIAYVKGAVWVDTPARLFQHMLAETVGAKTGKIVLDLRQYTTDPGLRVMGTLQMFGIDADKSEAVVTYDAVITRGTRFETRRFESRVPVAVINAPNAGAALNRAANTVATEVSDWVK